MHPNSLANLTGNPTGRPKGFQLWSNIKTMKEYSVDLLEAIVIDPRSTVNKVISAQYILKAAKGDTKVIEYMIDREDGKVTQKVESNINVHGLQSIGCDVSGDVIKVVSMVKDANSMKDSLLLDMNDDLLVDNV